MLPDDVFFAGLRAAATDVRAAVADLADVADGIVDSDGRALHLRVRPRTPGTCALEVLIAPTQRAEIEIGGLVHTDVTIDAMVVAPMIVAVSRGDVVQRRSVSATTGWPMTTATLVTLADGRSVELTWPPAVRPAPDRIPRDLGDGAVVTVRRFLPYRR
jgi:hypothetical protein